MAVFDIRRKDCIVFLGTDMAINDDLPDKEKLHFQMNEKTYISSSVYSEVIQVSSVGGEKAPQYWIIKMSVRLHYP